MVKYSEIGFFDGKRERAIEMVEYFINHNTYYDLPPRSELSKLKKEVMAVYGEHKELPKYPFILPIPIEMANRNERLMNEYSWDENLRKQKVFSEPVNYSIHGRGMPGDRDITFAYLLGVKIEIMENVSFNEAMNIIYDQKRFPLDISSLIVFFHHICDKAILAYKHRWCCSCDDDKSLYDYINKFFVGFVEKIIDPAYEKIFALESRTDVYQGLMNMEERIDPGNVLQFPPVGISRKILYSKSEKNEAGKPEVSRVIFDNFLIGKSIFICEEDNTISWSDLDPDLKRDKIAVASHMGSISHEIRYGQDQRWDIFPGWVPRF